MIDTVYRTVQVLLNKNGKGVITPDRFNVLAEAAQAKVVSHLAEEYRRVVTRKMKGYDDTTLSVIRTAYDTFLKSTEITKEDGKFNMPSDCVTLESLYTPNGVEIEIVPTSRYYAMSRHADKAFPIASYESGEIKVSSTPSVITATYRRKCKTPKWTYIRISYNQTSGITENVSFNPNDPTYQDFELPESYMYAIIDELLTSLGLHFRENEILQVAQSEKQNALKQETV